MTTEQQQVDIEQFKKAWSENLPSLNSQGDPFYTLMKFNGDANTGEVFAFPGMDFGFGVQILTVTLFPTEEIGKDCEAFLSKTNPEWKLVGLTEQFLDLLLKLVRVQQLKLSISLNPNDSVIFATAKVPELAAAIKEKGFHEDLLKVTEQ